MHRRLYTSEKIGTVSLDDYLQYFVGELQTSLQDASGPHKIRLETDRISISTDKAISLGVIVGELVTNAFKYAYGQREVCEVRVALRRSAPAQARLVVEDDGVGFDPDAESAGTGLGSKILQAMSRSLDATLTHDRSHKGARVVVEFPLKDADADEQAAASKASA